MKKIGVLGGLQGSVFGITIPYYEYAVRFGEVVIINPLSDELNTDIDLLILVGGADLNPVAMGHKPSLYTNKSNPVREWFEREVLHKYIANATPIFGICLGLQSLVMYFHGSLEQHNSDFHEFSFKHRGELVHQLSITSDALNDTDRFPFLKHYSKRKIEVNSLHHQAANANDMGDGIIAHFLTKGYDKLPEVIVHRELPFVGVQFHPEELNGRVSQRLADDYIHSLLNL